MLPMRPRQAARRAMITKGMARHRFCRPRYCNRTGHRKMFYRTAEFRKLLDEIEAAVPRGRRRPSHHGQLRYAQDPNDANMVSYKAALARAPEPGQFVMAWFERQSVSQRFFSSRSERSSSDRAPL